MRWPEGPPHLALNRPYLFFLCFVFCFFEGSSEVALRATSLGPKPSLFVFFVCVFVCLFCFVCLFVLFFVFFFVVFSFLSMLLSEKILSEKNPMFPLKKGIFVYF